DAEGTCERCRNQDAEQDGSAVVKVERCAGHRDHKTEQLGDRSEAQRGQTCHCDFREQDAFADRRDEEGLRNRSVRDLTGHHDDSAEQPEDERDGGDSRDRAIVRCRVDLAVGGDDGDRSDQDERGTPDREPEGGAQGPHLQPLRAKGGADRISAPPVRSWNASSSEVASATRSCRTMAFATASAPTRSGGAEVTSWSPSRLPSKPACTSASRKAAACGERPGVPPAARAVNSLTGPCAIGLPW